MKAFFSMEDEKSIKELTDYLMEKHQKGKLKETDFCETGGIKVEHQYTSKDGRVLFSVYKLVGDFTKTLKKKSGGKK
ncbi:MAG TPA: hypothetical protein ENH95_02940 [Nitrosopumilus sp.]|nr:hypothetical protein [Nitrosopumilus sp.]